MGQTFNRLTIVGLDHKRWGARVFLCTCSCGGKTSTTLGHLTAGTIRSCGCLARELASARVSVPMVGRIFGRLTVIGVAGKSKNGTLKWECACSCSQRITAVGSHLRRGTTQSCGCLVTDLLRARNACGPAWQADFNVHALQARKRGIPFELSLEDYARLISTECFYCGAVPSNKARKSTPLPKKSGIDRLDSTRGYSADNSVSCCRPCNMAKGSMTREAFTASTKARYEHLRKKGLL